MKCTCIKDWLPFFKSGNEYTYYDALDIHKDYYYNINGHYLTDDEFSKHFINLRKHNLDIILGNEL